jgi:cyanophycinase
MINDSHHLFNALAISGGQRGASSVPRSLARGLSHALVCAVAALSALGANAQTAIVIGGALHYDNDAVWQRIVNEAGGPGARIAVFANAAGNPERSGAQIVRALNERGAQAELIPVAPKMKDVDWKANRDDPAWIAKVRQSRGVFFSGGAQELIASSLQPDGQRSAMLQAVWQVFEAGGVVAGTSAGAAIMSEVMFRDAQDVMNVLRGQMREGQEIDRGLGFVGPDLFIDQHFLKRGRIGRMLPLMLAKGYRWGLGVEENSAAVIRGSSIEVIGARGALLADLTDAQRDASLPGFNVRGARLSYLDRGDRHDWRTGKTTPSEAKRSSSPIDPAASDFKPYFSRSPFFMDILGDGTIVHAMANLVDGPAPELRGLATSYRPARTPDSAGQAGAQASGRTAFEFRLYKGPGTVAWFTGAMGGEDYTVLNVRLDITPVVLSDPLYTPAVTPATGASAKVPAAARGKVK